MAWYGATALHYQRSWAPCVRRGWGRSFLGAGRAFERQERVRAAVSEVVLVHRLVRVILGDVAIEVGERLGSGRGCVRYFPHAVRIKLGAQVVAR